MILMITFTFHSDYYELYTVLKVPDRLDYNVPKIWEDFDEWIEDNQKYLCNVHNDEDPLLLDSNDFIYWMKNFILEKDEHIRVLEQDVDRAYINNKYPKNKRHILYFENTGDGHLEYMGGTYRARWC